MKTMAWLLELKLRDFQADAFEKSTITAVMPPGGHNPMPTLFTVTNGARTDIAQYKIICSVNRLLWDSVAIKAHPPNDNTFSYIARDVVVPLRAAGGSDSASCLEKYIRTPNLELFTCADVTVTFVYRLASDPFTETRKSARFVTAANGRDFEWIPKNPNDPETYCLELQQTLSNP